MSTLIPDPANNLSAKKRIIKINKNVDAVQAVYTEGEVMDILNRNKEHIAVMNCFCRTKRCLRMENVTMICRLSRVWRLEEWLYSLKKLALQDTFP